MDPIRPAAILLVPAVSSYRLLLDHDIAGLNLLKRLVLTLNRAGIEEFTLLAKENLRENIQAEILEDIKQDFRFKGKLNLFGRQEFLQKPQEEKIRILGGPSGILLLQAHLVTTPKLIREFIWQACGPIRPNKPGIARLGFPPDHPQPVYYFPSGALAPLENYLLDETLPDAVERIDIEEDKRFLLKTVQDGATAREAERELIENHKHHYTQIMDKWCNVFFSIPISSVLVKTPLTPNQITLMGLIIGLCAGWFFSLGTHMGQLFGGILLAGTAIWDCCDGDVARLKFMESDFGETLDTVCDNIINVFIFTGMMIGTARSEGLAVALIPFLLLVAGGLAILILIYYPRGGKGSFFQGTRIYGLIQVLASRNFIYIILVFAIFGRTGWFLWLAGFGSLAFALILFLAKRNILLNAPALPK